MPVSSQVPTDKTHGTASNASPIYVCEARQVVPVLRQDAELLATPLPGFFADQWGLRVTSRWDVVLPQGFRSAGGGTQADKSAPHA